MCTVTFIPTTEGIYFTSNRDESKARGLAHPPQPDKALIYPRDPDKGGSWIAMKNTAAAVLLNGAFTKHQRRPAYRKSRGLVFLDIIQADKPLAAFQQSDLDDIEPFTLILFSAKQLWEARWTGKMKFLAPLDPATPHIWSSSTLYSEPVATERKRRFGNWLRSTRTIGQQEVFGFHRSAVATGEKIATVSITSIFLQPDNASMTHTCLNTGASTTFSTPTRKRSFPRLKTFWIRMKHWEYWPSAFIYGPLYPYWLWLSIKARSFFFFSAANPGLENAGFTNERKSGIYKHMPTGSYPRTQWFPQGAKAAPTQQMNFPLIAKPDIGERGTRVQLLHSQAELEEYANKSNVDFLLQEFIGYPFEAGIFYADGHITGIVEKEFLTLTGDGRSTMRTLIQKNDRFLLQLQTLTKQHANQLDTILPAGINHTLVPYGNHCRGAKFLDASHRITPQLTATISKLCRQIPGFDFGRLDIKFNNWEQLAQGINFSIIEVNGAGSEPTHIYDPKHSLLFAWKEIIRHWRLVYTISMRNRKKGIPLMTTAEGWKMIKGYIRQNKQLRQE